MTTNNRNPKAKLGRGLIGLFALTMILFIPLAAQSPAPTKSWWPQDYTVRRDDAAGKLILSTP